MTEFDIFSKAMEVIGRRWRDGQSKEQEEIFFFVQDALTFISETGQWYPFLDFRDGRESHVPLGACEEVPTRLRDRMRRTERYFQSLLDEPAVPEEAASTHTLLSGLRFVCSTGQTSAFEDYLQRLASNAPPMVLAAFETNEQAETWLKSHPNPPGSGRVLIGKKYHDVVYDRESNFRRLPWNRDMERYLGGLERDDPPVAQATFETLEQAEAWFRSQAHPPLRTWVRVGGEFYLAVYHPNVNHRALYPLSMAIRPPEEDEDVTDEPR